MRDFRKYIVRYKKSRSQSDDFECIRINKWDVFSATLENLDERTQYMIQVAALDKRERIGDYSEPLNVTTGRGEDKNSYLSS